jgi:acetolactate synthase-1/2/3 large subunit
MPDDRLDQLADRLAAAGVRHAFGVTGSGASLSLIAALAARGVRYLPVSHEAAGAVMAGAATAAGGRPAVSISIKGPGLANALPGIAANAFEHRPALSIAEAFGPAVPAFRRHKRLDHAGLLAPVVKGSLTLDRLADLPALLDLAAAEVPGPVHLELCDGGENNHEHGGGRGSARPSGVGAVPTDPRTLDEAIRAVRSATRPVVVAGSLALRRGYGPRLESLGVPVFTTAAAKGLVDESLPHAAGVFTGDGKSLAPESSLLAEADLVLGVGLRNAELLSPKPFGRRTILLDEVDAGLSDGLGGDLVLADAAETRHVLEQLAGRGWGADLVTAAVRRMRDALLGPRRAGGRPRRRSSF